MNIDPEDSAEGEPKGAQSTASGERPVIVAALGRLGLSIVRLLLAQGRTVRVITEAGCPSWHVRVARELGAELFMGDFRDPEIWAAAGVQDCQSAMITSADDSRNLETSIRVKVLASKTRIITRVDAPHLGHRLQLDFDLNAALCPATLSAGHFVTTALEASANRSVISKSERLEPRHRPPWQSLVLFILAACLASGTLVFHYAKDIPWVDAVYFTMSILTTVGFGDYHLHHDPAWLKLFGMLLMVAGISLIALLVSLFSHFLITGEATRQQHERAARRLDRHVIVAGMGSLGMAVVKELHKRGIPAVCVELDGSRREAIPLKQSVPWIEGDATDAETLLRAGIDRARALLAVTSADGTNLEIALRARSLTDRRSAEAPLPVIISCQDELLASRLRAASNAYIPLSSADLAAPVFVKAALALANGTHS
jgi:voltage-gated potassium channel Kch